MDIVTALIETEIPKHTTITLLDTTEVWLYINSKNKYEYCLKAGTYPVAEDKDGFTLIEGKGWVHCTPNTESQYSTVIMYKECDKVLLVTGELATIGVVIDDTHYFVTVTAVDGWSTFREICIDDIQCKL